MLMTLRRVWRRERAWSQALRSNSHLVSRAQAWGGYFGSHITEKRKKRRAINKSWRQRRSWDPNLGPVCTFITTDERANQ